MRRAHNKETKGDYQDYDSEMKGASQDFRNTLEELVEQYLLGGVVTRFSREVKTKNLRYLKLVTEDDINFITSLMTKYSYLDHSSPESAGTPKIEYDELLVDLKRVQSWCKEMGHKQNTLE